MSSVIQDRNITIAYNGKTTIWGPRDQISPAPVSILATVEEAEAGALPVQEGEKRHNTRLKIQSQESGKEDISAYHMAKREHPTKVFNVGVDTFSATGHSLVNRLNIWKSNHPKSSKSNREGCWSWKSRFGPNVRKRSHTQTISNEQMGDSLRNGSMIHRSVTYGEVQRMMESLKLSAPAPAPIPISGTEICSGCYCLKIAQENQQDGNVRFDMKDAAFLSASSVSEESMVNINIESSPTQSPFPFPRGNDSLPEDGQYPSPEMGCFSISEDVVLVSDLEISPSAEGCTGLSADLLKVRDDFNSQDGPVVVCPAGVGLEGEVKDAMESYLPQPRPLSGIFSSPEGSAPKKIENGGEGSEINLTESFSRTRASLSSNDDHSAPSHSFHIEKPYSRLGSDFVDVEDYLVEPSDSFPKPTYPASDSSATEIFGFKPTGECMPGLWLGTCSQEPSKEVLTTSRPWQDMSKIQRNPPDLRCPRSFFMSKEEVLNFLERVQSTPQDASLSFAKCRPIPDPFHQRLPSLSLPLSQSTTCSDSTTSACLRGGDDPDRFSLLRPIGKGKLIGNVERGRKLLSERVQRSDCYLLGGWGEGGTWREFCRKMEKRIEKGKETEKVKTEKGDEEAADRVAVRGG